MDPVSGRVSSRRPSRILERLELLKWRLCPQHFGSFDNKPAALQSLLCIKPQVNAGESILIPENSNWQENAWKDKASSLSREGRSVENPKIYILSDRGFEVFRCPILVDGDIMWTLLLPISEHCRTHNNPFCFHISFILKCVLSKWCQIFGSLIVSTEWGFHW